MKPVITSTAPDVIAAPKLEPKLVASLAAVYVIWSSTYLAMRIVVHEPGALPPLLSASIRFCSAGALMFLYAVRKGAAFPAARDWLRVAPSGVLLFVGGNGFVSIASQSAPSGGIAVVCALMPIWAGILGAAVGVRPTGREWLSLFIGFAGVVVLLGGPSLAGKPVHIVLVILSPMLWAAGSLLSRRTRDVGGVHGAFIGPALQMITGGIALMAIAVVRGERIPVDARATAWLALLYLIVFGSLVAFTAYAWLLRNARPVVATSYAYVNPILAVFIGAALYHEPLGWTTLVANVLIVGAVILAVRRTRHA
jgi:drug/metabolite transporter (DMT)-like permease